MDLSVKDTNQLENILADELVGSNPSFENGLMGEDDEGKRNENIKRFANWVFVCDECKKKFREKHQVIYNNKFINHIKEGSIDSVRGYSISWLEYYKGVLIKEIRDVKLKKLIK